MVYTSPVLVLFCFSHLFPVSFLFENADFGLTQLRGKDVTRSSQEKKRCPWQKHSWRGPLPPVFPGAPARGVGRSTSGEAATWCV